jgi:hypothetical protein
MTARLVLLLVLAVAASGCTLPKQSLARAQRALEQNSHERALAICRDLERDYLRLSEDDRAKYAYVRGMTDYRMGYRIDARYWLASAKSMTIEHPQALPPEWTARLDDALASINEEVFDHGVEGLENTLRRGGGESHPGAKKHPRGEEEP